MIKDKRNLGMSKEKYQFIKDNMHLLDLDLVNGAILNRNARSTNTYGYLQVKLSGKTIPQHQIFMVALFDKECIGKQIDHVDQCKTNNCCDNLKLVTHLENQKNIKGFIQTPIKATNIDTGEILLFESQAETARFLGTYQGNVREVLIGKRKRVKCWTFERVIKEIV